MPGKSWVALYMTLLTTIALVFGFLYFAGPTAVTSLVAVLGFLLAITEFFYLHVISANQKHQSSNNSSHKQIQRSSEKTLPSPKEMFRRSKFSRSKDS